MTATTVRRATAADAATVQQLLLELAESDGEAVGYVSAVRQLNLWIGRDVLALDDLYVRAHARGRGVGERLMATLASHAAGDGLTVTWGLQSDNHGARRFYLRLGATLHDKTVAAWRPHEYAALLAR